jgi:hypothetical protein
MKEVFYEAIDFFDSQIIEAFICFESGIGVNKFAAN